MDISLLYKLCSHELLPEEREEVEEWVAGDVRRQVFLERFCQREAGESYHLPDNKKGDYRKDFLKNIGYRRRKRVQHRIWGALCGAVAAAVLVLLAFHGWHGGDVETGIGSSPCVGLLDCDGCSEDLKLPKEAAKAVEVKRHSKGMQELVVGRGDEYDVVLPDGSHVWLNSDSRLRYPEHFRGVERRVFLEGEAYFSVVKDAEHPFVVDAKGVNIKVYGTEFNVTARDEGHVRTTLVSGSVAVKLEGERQETILTPGLTAEVDPQSHSLNISQHGTDLYAGWKDGRFCFEDTPLEVLFEELALWYDLQVEFETPDAKKECFTGSLSRNMPLVDLLRMLQGTTYVSFRLEGRHLFVGESGKADKEP